MKKIISVLICLGLIGGICSCSKETTITKSSDEVTTATTTTAAQDNNETMSSDEINAIGDIDVDEGLVTVSITIPADLVGEDASQESVDSTVAEKGYISGTYNDDGSVTYTMTKAQHKEVMKSLAESFDKTFQELVDSEDYPNIVAITHNEDYTDFTVTYNGDSLSLADSFTVLTFYYVGGLYGVFNGSRPDNVHIAFVNADTGEIVSEANSKDVAASE